MKTRFITLIILAATLAACSTAPDRSAQRRPQQRPPESRLPAPSERDERQQPSRQLTLRDIGFNPATARSEDIPIWLEQALTAPAEIATELRLRAAEVLLRDGEPAQADDAVSELVLPEQSPENAIRLALVRARVLRSYGKFKDALSILADPLLDSYIHTSPVRRQIQFHQMRATLFAIEGDNLAAAKEWTFIDPLLTRVQQPGNRAAIWQALMEAPSQALAEVTPTTSDRDFLGWLELAAVAKNNQGDLEAQISQRDAWLSRWPSHPANAVTGLPGGLDKLDELVVGRPNQVALILPVTGRLARFGKAIRDGFIAAYIQAREQGAFAPTIRLYDSANEDAVNLYQRVVQEGADMIIGPLQKENLEALVQQSPNLMARPTLALNRIEGNRFPNGFFQFGLNPEDEAVQVADIARKKGFEHVMVISPQGSWGSKVATAFVDRWQQLGGKVVASTTFDASSNNYSKQIKDTLQIKDSERRRSKLQQIVGLRMEFEPRRRSDIDFIFLVAHPEEGRSIKPLLAYHYAGNLPVYATSHIYRGIEDPTRDQDINDVHFIDVPWVFNKTSAIRQTIADEIPGSGPMQRMYALGIDSFRLHLRMVQLRQDNEASVFGETGTLSLNALGQIERQLVLAHIKRGRAEVSVTAKDEDASQDLAGTINIDGNTP